MPSLRQAFPKVQFIAASHSPQIIGSLKPEEVIERMADAFKGSNKDIAKQAVLLELMGYDNLSRSQARLLLGAIISDTFSLTSPTTTPRDRAAVNALLPLADLALEPFAQTLLERRTQLGDAPLAELLIADEKAYQIAGYTLSVSQICVMHPAQLQSRQAELVQAMQARLEQDKLDA